MSKRLHIIIAEPSPIIRCGLVAMLQSADSLSCDLAEVSDPSTLLGMVQNHQPDLLIVSPTHLGHFIPSQLRATIGNESMRIVALQSSFADSALLQNYDEIISIYDSSEVIIKKIMEITRDQDDAADVRKELSAREKEIIVCVVKGMTNKQIADTLCLSTHTIIAHRRNIASKLQIHSPSGLTIYAIVNKLVDLSDIKG